MPNIQALSATLTRETAEVLITLLEATPADRFLWSPLEKGRTIHHQLVECCLANRKWTAILQTRTYANFPQEEAEAEYARGYDPAILATRLRATAADLAQAILSVPDADLSLQIETAWGPYSLARSCMHACWNMMYHEGQINYIQTLYGDQEEHDPDWNVLKSVAEPGI
jgi:uncharacterized damage-inducible protein DinB